MLVIGRLKQRNCSKILAVLSVRRNTGIGDVWEKGIKKLTHSDFQFGHLHANKTNLVDGILAVSDLLVDAVAEGLVLGRPLGVLLVDPGVDGGDVGLTRVVLGVSEVLQVGDLLLASVVLRLGEVVQVGDLALACVVLRLGPPTGALES